MWKGHKKAFVVCCRRRFFCDRDLLRAELGLLTTARSNVPFTWCAMKLLVCGCHRHAGKLCLAKEVCLLGQVVMFRYNPIVYKADNFLIMLAVHTHFAIKMKCYILHHEMLLLHHKKLLRAWVWISSSNRRKEPLVTLFKHTSLC